MVVQSNECPALKGRCLWAWCVKFSCVPWVTNTRIKISTKRRCGRALCRPPRGRARSPPRRAHRPRAGCTCSSCRGARCSTRAWARKVLGWLKRRKLAHAFLGRQYSYRGLKLAQLLDQLGVFLTLRGGFMSCSLAARPLIPLGQSVRFSSSWPVVASRPTWGSVAIVTLEIRHRIC